jgi:hypothetical protein
MPREGWFLLGGNQAKKHSLDSTIAGTVKEKATKKRSEFKKLVIWLVILARRVCVLLSHEI